MADQKINGALYRSMVIEGALAIAEKKEQANELNVFPVPDGDTGTNMSMTMGSAMAEMEKLAEPTLAKAADATASALLRGARGNSGVILSLLFRGMAKKLRETDEADGRTLALALREGVDTAYKAVMKPAEGTILTVSRVAAQHAVELCQAEPTLTAEQVLAAIIEQGHTALEETVHQNPVLEKAMSFSGPPPVYTPSFHTYVIRSWDGERYYKLQIISWYDANVQIGDEGGRISYYLDELK